MPVTPPRRTVPLPKAAAPTSPAAPAAKAEKPVKAASPAPAKAEKAVTKTPTKAAPVAKAEKPAKVEKTSKKPATENVVPKMPVIKSKVWSEEQIGFALLLRSLDTAGSTVSKGGARIEIRHLDDHFQAYLNAKHGVKPSRHLTNLDDVITVIKVVKSVPTELLPWKWAKCLERLVEATDAAKAVEKAKAAEVKAAKAAAKAAAKTDEE